MIQLLLTFCSINEELTSDDFSLISLVVLKASDIWKPKTISKTIGKLFRLFILKTTEHRIA